MGNRGTPTIFTVLFMYNPNTGYATEMRDIMGLQPEARDKVIVYPQVALPFTPEDTEAGGGCDITCF